MRTTLITSLLSSLCLACGGAVAPQTPPVHAPAPAAERPLEGAPLGRLPSYARPLKYALTLQIVPDTGRFQGDARVDVQLDEPREVLWLHGQDLAVSRATLLREGAEPVELRYEPQGDQGVVALRASAPIEPGRFTLRFEYDAALGKNLRGLYRVEAAGESYAFTQLEPTGARAVFPCFDEPAFKTPFDVTLRVKREHVAIANAREMASKPVDGGLKEVTFATTERLPTYLIAFAVGPLDVVEAPPIAANDVRARPVPFRAVSVKGRGAQLAYAIEHTPPMLEVLEDYFQQPYPYDKLDIIAVPDFAAGAMENVGAITFREQLLLIGQDPPERQLRGFAYVMAHELAHMWFGNLVTMPWWDDIWLNEAFATWMGGRVVEARYPAYESPLSHLAAAHYAMDVDAQVSARQIRQPIESNHDIENAFDSITYSKGGAVLAMFERYLGRDTFREGLRQYMRAHAHGNARAEDLVAALSKASGRQLHDPFFSFLEQPGVPLVEAALTCGDGAPSLKVKQSRYLPVGSKGERDKTWQLPLCVRYDADGEPAETCTLLTSAEASVPLPAGRCPGWVMPNAGAAGYYRWALAERDLSALREKGWAALTTPERVSTASSLRAALEAGSLPAASVLEALAGVLDGADRHTLSAALGVFTKVRHALLTDAQLPAYRAQQSRLLAPTLGRLGLLPKQGVAEDGNRALLRGEVLAHLAFEARDAKVRAELDKLGRAALGLREAERKLPTDLRGHALRVAVQEGGAPVFEAALARLFASEDALERGRLLGALASTHDPTLATRARALALDERLKVNEVLVPLYTQAHMDETRDATWQWLTDNYSALAERLSVRRAGQLPALASGFCSEPRAEQVSGFFADKIDSLSGGPRKLANTLERIRLCAALRARQGASAQAYYAR